MSDGYVCTQIPAFFTATGLLLANKAVVKRRLKSLVKQKGVFRFIKENTAGIAVQVLPVSLWGMSAPYSFVVACSSSTAISSCSSLAFAAAASAKSVPADA